MITKLQYLRGEALDMLASLERRLADMNADELEIVTARLVDLMIELKERGNDEKKKF